MERLKDSFKWVIFDMRKTTMLMVVLLVVAALIEAFTVNSAFNVASLNDGDISQSHVIKLSIIQNVQVLILTAFLCYFMSRVIDANVGAWGQIKAQFHAFFFSVFVGLVLAMIAGSLMNFLLAGENLEMQILGITLLFGLFMIMCYWHYYAMYLVRRKMQNMGVKYTTKVMLIDTFSLFKHWSYVVRLSLFMLTITVASVAFSSLISATVDSIYIGTVAKAFFYPFSIVALVWFSLSLRDCYGKP